MWYVYPVTGGYAIRFAVSRRSVAGFVHESDAADFAIKLTRKVCGYSTNLKGVRRVRRLRHLQGACR